MKQRYRIAALILAITLFLSLCACGLTQDYSLPATTHEPTPELTPEPTPEPEPDPLDLEDALIRSAMEEEGFGLGDKLAVFIPGRGENGQYSFNGAYVPEGLRAQTPEEIGAFLEYRTNKDYEHRKNKDGGEGYFRSVSLVGAYGRTSGELLSTYGLKYGDFEINETSEWYNVDRNIRYSLEQVDGGALFNSYSMTEKTYVDFTLDEWLEERVPWILECERQLADVVRVNRKPEVLALSAGNKLIGYDEETGLYTMERIGKKQQAMFLEEIGFILSYHSTWESEEHYYRKDFGSLSTTSKMVPIEVCHVRVLVANSGEELIAYECRHVPIFYSEDDAGIPTGETASASEIWASMHDVFTERKLDWPFPEYEETYYDPDDSRTRVVEDPLGLG